MRHKLLMLSLAAIALRVAMPAQTHQPVPAVQAFSKVPISFEENRGQVDSQVRFLAHMQRSAMFFTPAEAVLTLYSENSEKRPIASDIHIRWVGGNANATV